MIAKVEGPDWLIHQQRFGGTRNGFDSVLEEWQKINAMMSKDLAAFAANKGMDAQDAYDMHSLKSETLSDTIYGAGGYHRYIVRYDGEIVFSRYHSRPVRIEDAERAGFTTG
jgi:hypothetical protein